METLEMERHALRDGMSTRGHKKRGAFDGWTTISIKRRYGVDKTTVQTEEWSIKMAHNGVGIWSAPSLRDHIGVCFQAIGCSRENSWGMLSATRSWNNYVWMARP